MVESTGAELPTLYSYWRSSAAYRVRIVLALKELPYRYIAVPLHTESRAPSGVPSMALQDYVRDINPQGLVPLLEHGGQRIAQSLAIIDYLDRRFPDKPVIPEQAAVRARALSIAQLIACEIHPLNNLRVLNRLRDVHGLDDAARDNWYSHWVRAGFSALERMLAAGTPAAGSFAAGERPSVADAYLVPQVANARRFKVPIDDFPTILRIDAACRALPAFRRAAPEAQPDAERPASS
jgi:maleylacetoacetate isomerase